jgi:hypothetical protein
LTQDRWRRAVVGPHHDHHLVDGEPMYAARFDRVLPFHAPGLAPVRRGPDAWHIDATGSAAYEARFRQTFGFYGDLAAVEDELGWCHIPPTGVPVYVARYAWCGNFQDGRCAVRAHDGRYFHITPGGERVYAETWRYTGDYDERGRLFHERWFLDLDVFHKGFARARDVDGWHHVDREGRSVYERRFAMVEPFYNGQARVERFDGGLEVIDEVGGVVLELRAPRYEG